MLKRSGRLLSWRNCLAAVILLLATTIGLAYFVATRAERELERRYADSAAAGLPTTIEEAVADSLKESEDVLVPLSSALATYEKAEASYGSTGGDFRTRLAAVADSSPEYEAAMAATARCSGFRFTGTRSDLLRHGGIDHILLVRRIRQIEHSRASAALRVGDADRCIRLSLRLFHIARCMTNEPTLLGYTETVCRLQNGVVQHLNIAIRKGTASAATLDAVEKAAASVEDGNRPLARVFACERAAAFANYYGDMPWAATAWMRPWTNTDRVKLFDAFQDHIDLVSSPYTDAEDLESRRSAQYRSGSFLMRNSGAINLLPNLLETRREAEMSRAFVRCLRVVAALQRSENRNRGIAELGLPPEAIMDPFATGTLKVVAVKEGWTVYSIGPNGRDDGGAISRSSGEYLDVGLGPKPHFDGF